MTAQQNQPQRDTPTEGDDRVQTTDGGTAHDQTLNLSHQGDQSQGNANGDPDDLDVRVRQLVDQRLDERAGEHDATRMDPDDNAVSAEWSSPAPTDLSTIKTSPAAAFSLVFGLSALICALTLILSPLAVLFGLIGLVLGIIGRKHGKRPDLTGAGVAAGGLVMSVLGLLLGIGVITGAATFLNNSENIDTIETQLEELRDALPTTVPQELTS